MFYCEVCGEAADIHHIVHRHEGGIDFKLNLKYLCPYHHRGKNSPHRNKEIDLKYKISLQQSLENLLIKNYYTLEELVKILQVPKTPLKKITKNLKLYKEGYLTEDIIFCLMGKRKYPPELLEDYIFEKLLSNY